MPGFDDVLTRVGWAEHLFQRLEQETAAYIQNGGVSVDTEVQLDGGHVYRARIPAPPPVELALRTADVLHHLRAALDNAVWTLHPNPSRRTQFPVASTEEQWANVQPQIAGLSDELTSAIRDLQPLAEHGLGQDLVQLNNLAAWDRHRFPQLLVGATFAAGFAVTGDLPHDLPLPQIVHAVLEDNAVVGTWPREGYWADHDLPIVDFDIDLQFGPDTPAIGRPVRVALAAYQAVVDRALNCLVAFI